MKEIYVDNIIEEKYATVGYLIHDETIKKSMGIVFSPSDINILYTSFRANKGGHAFERFCQFVVYVELGEVGWVVKVIDFHQKTDNVIDEYSDLLKIGWSKQARDDMFRIFQEIEEDKDNMGKMVIVD